VAVVLLRNEYVTRGTTTVPDSVIVDIVDEVYLPLVRRPCLHEYSPPGIFECLCAGARHIGRVSSVTAMAEPDRGM
jgi:hypothetical protein